MFSDIDVFDLLRSGTILVAFTVAFLSDKKGESRVWLLAESIFMGLYGLTAYFFPGLLLGYVTVGKLDNFHLYLYQTVGALLVGQAVVSLRQYRANSQDSQVTTGWLLSRVVGLTFVIVNGMCSKLSLAEEELRFSDQISTCGGLPFFLMLFGSLAKLWQHLGSDYRGGSSSKGEPASALNRHLLFSILINLSGMILNYRMPEFLMENFMGLKYDGFHLYIIKASGAIGLTFIFQEMTAFHFENDSDKRNFFIGHNVVVAMALPLILLNQYRHLFYPAMSLCFTLAWVFVQFGNCTYAACLPIKDKKY